MLEKARNAFLNKIFTNCFKKAGISEKAWKKWLMTPLRLRKIQFKPWKPILVY